MTRIVPLTIPSIALSWRRKSDVLSASYTMPRSSMAILLLQTSWCSFRMDLGAMVAAMQGYRHLHLHHLHHRHHLHRRPRHQGYRLLRVCYRLLRVCETRKYSLFGLGSMQSIVEDKAVDLYVLERAFLSTHPDSDSIVAAVLDSYKLTSKKSKETLNKLEQVRKRGRKRDMFG